MVFVFLRYNGWCWYFNLRWGILTLYCCTYLFYKFTRTAVVSTIDYCSIICGGWFAEGWLGQGCWLFVVVVLTLTRIIKSVVTGQAPVTLELRNTPGKTHTQPKVVHAYQGISQLTQFMPPPETYKSEIWSQSTMCQVQAGAYVSLLTPGETKYSDCHPRKTTTYILHVVSITTHTH